MDAMISANAAVINRINTVIRENASVVFENAATVVAIPTNAGGSRSREPLFGMKNTRSVV
jgi:hypothetical protein